MPGPSPPSRPDRPQIVPNLVDVSSPSPQDIIYVIQQIKLGVMNVLFRNTSRIIYVYPCTVYTSWAGIFKHSTGARNRVGIVLSYRLRSTWTQKQTRVQIRVPTEVLFILPAEYGIFLKNIRNSSEFSGIFKVKFPGIPLVGIGTHPTPLLPASVPLSPEPGWGGHTCLRVRGWQSPNSDDWRKSLAFCLLCGRMYLWKYRNQNGK